jgi:hypothetical protein
MNIDIEKITKSVADKSEITIEQARKAVLVFLDELQVKVPEFEKFLKEKLPEFEALVKETPLAGLKR